jgi:Flp pilus assembly protein TadG
MRKYNFIPKRLRVRLTKRLQRDERGIAIVEFAILAPTFMLMLMAFYDFAHSLYAQTIIKGALQKAARDSGLNTTTTTQGAIDTRVSEMIRTANNSAQITFSRRFYKSYADAAARLAETYNDTNGNGVCDNNELFVDRNNNGVRDIDGADEGQGGANDDVLYTVSVQYPRLFPMHHFLGWDQNVTVTSSTILKNQPWGEQTQYGDASNGHCI